MVHPSTSENILHEPNDPVETTDGVGGGDHWGLSDIHVLFYVYTSIGACPSTGPSLH